MQTATRRKKNDPHRLRMIESRKIKRWMRDVGIPMNVERIREIEKDVREKRMAREIFEQAAHLAEMVETKQENDHGAANTGGAAAAAHAIRACSRIFFGDSKPNPAAGDRRSRSKEDEVA